MLSKEGKNNYNSCKFYGPFREVTKQNFKNACTKDSVRDALVNIDNGGDNQHLWLTSTKESYKVKDNELSLENKTSNISRDMTHFVLGFDHSSYVTTNQDFKPHPDNKKRSLCKRETKTHIADFCPEYTETSNDKSNTEYQISFDMNCQDSRPVPQTLEERRKHTNNLRETHFKLGDCDNHLRTETMHSFSKDLSTSDSKNRSNAIETYTSCIFRPGDWNRVHRSLVNSGVTQRDFTAPAEEMYASNDQARAEKTYHRATHFNLGSTLSKSTSLYHNDFALSLKGNQTQHRAVAIKRPTSSHIFINNDPPDFITTTQKANFEDKNRDLVLSIRNERIASLEEVKKRHAENSVPIYFKYDPSCPVQSTPLSLTTSDFHNKHLPLEKKDGSFTNTYNHLSGNYHAVNLSEAKERYRSHDHKSKILRQECKVRRRDNKSTHFDFGTDCLDDKRSEQTSQYRNHLPVDPNLRSAGKSLPQKKVYSHVYPNSRLDPISPSCKPISVMKTDYKRDNLSLDNDCTTINNNKIRSDPIIETHFFHIDNNYSAGTQSSTTKTDFMAPSTFKFLPPIEV